MKADLTPLQPPALLLEIWAKKTQIAFAAVVLGGALALACDSYQVGFAKALGIIPADLSLRPFEPWTPGPFGLTLMVGVIAVVVVASVAAVIEVARTRHWSTGTCLKRFALSIVVAIALVLWTPSNSLLFAATMAGLAAAGIEAGMDAARLASRFARWIEARPSSRTWSALVRRSLSGAPAIALLGVAVASIIPVLHGAGFEDGGRALSTGFQSEDSISQALFGNEPPTVVVRWIGAAPTQLSGDEVLARYLGANEGMVAVLDLGDCVVRKIPSGDVAIATRTGAKPRPAPSAPRQPSACG